MNNTHNSERVIDQYGYIIDCRKHDNDVISVNDNIINLIACGDTGPVRNLEEIVIQKGSSHVLGDMTDILKNSDIVFANLEAVYSIRGEPLNRIPVFRLNPKSFDIIKEANINIVSLANNHMFDYGPDAFIDTIKLLDKNRISYFGAGLTYDDSLAPLITEIKGTRVGFIGYREKEPKNFCNNGVVTPQINEKLIIKDITSLKREVDFLILSLHYGWEYQFYPSPRDVDLCRLFVDSGANLILGHHPHYPQGIERYKDSLIIYSLGNFIWDQKFKGHTNSSFVLELKIVKQSILSAKVIPFQMKNNYQLEVIKGDQLERGIEKINHLSTVLLSKSELNEEWYIICREKIILFIKDLYRICTTEENKYVNLVKLLKRTRHPRFRYTLLSFFLYIISFKEIIFEFKKITSKGAKRRIEKKHW